MTQKPTHPSALILGAGIAGKAAAFRLAQAGVNVSLVEATPYVGGMLSRLPHQFPTDDCGMCQLLPRWPGREPIAERCLRRELRHPRIEVLPSTHLKKVEGEAGDFTVTLTRSRPLVSRDLCVDCRQCLDVCPEESPDSFQGALSKRKAIYIRNPQAFPPGYSIDEEACTRCGDCVAVCPTGAINLEAPAEEQTLHAEVIIAAPGFKEFDFRSYPAYGGGRFPDVLSSVQLERAIAPNGPQGKMVLRRPSDGKTPQRIAFFQCVGSRDQQHDYCSAACCMIALKQALRIASIAPQAEISIYYMDLRAFGKGYHRYAEEAQKRLRLVRCRVPAVDQDPTTGTLHFNAETPEGELLREEADLVVLSTGFEPPDSTAQLLEGLGVEPADSSFGTCWTDGGVGTSRDGVYVCGTFTGPKDIPATITGALAAAGRATALLCEKDPSLRPALTRHKGKGKGQGNGEEKGAVGNAQTVSSSPSSTQAFSSSLPRGRQSFPSLAANGEAQEEGISVVLCSCMGEMPLYSLQQRLEKLPPVRQVLLRGHLCDPTTLASTAAELAENQASKVVVAACAPCLYEIPLRQALSAQGLADVTLRWVDLRDQGFRVLPEEIWPDFAFGQINAAMEAVHLSHSVSTAEEFLQPRVLVAGGGMAGLTAALTVGRAGLPVEVVEATSTLGGSLQGYQATFEQPEAAELLRKTLEKIAPSPNITLRTNTRLEEIQGVAGDFTVTLRQGDDELYESFGAVVLATGAEVASTEQYLYGQHPRVCLQRELSQRLHKEDSFPEKGPVVMIQCVGSRDEKHPYCSRSCCAEALHNAITLRQQDPNRLVVIAYRDLMAYGLRESLYTRARQEGVLFVRYEPGEEPRLALEEGEITLSLDEPILGRTLLLHPALVVLSTGVVSSAAQKELARRSGLPLDRDGFFEEANAKYRPVDLQRDGLFACGLALSPGSLHETMVQAQATAAQLLEMLAPASLEERPYSSFTREIFCAGCGLCVETCPYDARFLDPVARVARVYPHLCRGCGACTSVCPNSSALMRYNEPQQTLGELRALLAES